MSPGFRFRETMKGTFHLLSSPVEDRAIRLEAEAHADDLLQFLQDKTWRVEGEIELEGFAERQAVQGTIVFHLIDERRLPYRLTFEGNDGARYELRGQKEWSVAAPLESMVVLPASLYDEHGDEVGRCSLRFDLRNDLASFLKSFRVRLL